MTNVAYRSHTLSWINFGLGIAIASIIVLLAVLFRHQTATLELKATENEKWNQMLLAADVGQWRWNVTKDELHWDDAIMRIYGIEDKAFVPSYSTFAAQLDPADLGWVNEIVQKTLHEKGSYRAVFKLKNGRFIRAYGKVITKPDGDVIFAGVCMPADASEYTGKPIAYIKIHDANT
jgi:hypothetical protein